MTLKIENVGKIRSATLEFNGITVVVGDNNSGKSTVGKVLASLFSVLPTLDRRVKRARREYVFNEEVVRAAYRFRRMNIDTFTQLYEDEHLSEETLFSCLVTEWKSSKRWFGRQNTDEKLSDDELAAIHQAATQSLARIVECRGIPYAQLADLEIGKAFGRFFYGNVKRVGCDTARIQLTISGKEDVIVWDAAAHGSLSEPLVNRGWFIGSPLLINAVSEEFAPCQDHERMHEPILQRLTSRQDVNSVRKAIVGDKIKPIEERLEAILGGKIFYSEAEEDLMIKGGAYAKPLPVKALSMGLKSFALLRWMLEKGVLIERDVLVLDEPENHLHPRWQIVYAELIVMLQQCFNLTLLLTTHSPYFLEAIQLFAKKHHAEDLLSVYQPEIDEGGASSVFSKPITDNAELFQKFTAPLRDLDVLRAEQ